MKPVRLGPTLTQQVTERIRLSIISGELAAGTLHSASSIGDLYGVSRTPVREAANELARLGLVEIEPNRGIRILQTSIDSLLDGFELRLMVEVPMARKAAVQARSSGVAELTHAYEALQRAAKSNSAKRTLQADRDFHTVILELAGNSRAVEVLKEQRNMVLQTGVGTVPTSRSCMECFEDHVGIYESILAGDADGAAREMRAHILNTATLLIRQETAKRPEFGSIDVEAALGAVAS